MVSQPLDGLLGPIVNSTRTFFISSSLSLTYLRSHFARAQLRSTAAVSRFFETRAQRLCLEAYNSAGACPPCRAQQIAQTGRLSPLRSTFSDLAELPVPTVQLRPVRSAGVALTAQP